MMFQVSENLWLNTKNITSVYTEDRGEHLYIAIVKNNCDVIEDEHSFETKEERDEFVRKLISAIEANS